MRISIIIPTYEGLDYLINCSIPSVLNQTYKNYEVLIINDGPDKEVEDLVSQLDNRFIYHDVPRTEYGAPATAWAVGGAPGRNYGLEIARGDLIAPLDQDDVWYPHMLQSRVDFFNEYQNAVFSCSMI